MYTITEDVMVGPILFADDHLTPTKLQIIEQVEPLLEIQYTIDTQESVV